MGVDKDSGTRLDTTAAVFGVNRDDAAIAVERERRKMVEDMVKEVNRKFTWPTISLPLFGLDWATVREEALRAAASRTPANPTSLHDQLCRMFGLATSATDEQLAGETMHQIRRAREVESKTQKERVDYGKTAAYERMRASQLGDRCGALESRANELERENERLRARLYTLERGVKR